MPLLAIIALVLVSAGLILIAGRRRHDQKIDGEVEALFRAYTPSEETFSPADLDGLPEPVRNYLQRSIPEGQPYMRCVRLKQTGTMRSGPDFPWKPFRAEQYFIVRPPAFIWRAKLDFMPFVSVTARDKYTGQGGNMLIKIHSTFTIADARGPKITSAALIRYIAEMMWFPTAFFDNDFLRWEAVNEVTANAHATVNGEEVTVTFHFDESGDIASIEADRYRDAADTEPTKWRGYCKGYRDFDGVRIPSQIEVGWEPESGYFAWWRGTITTIDYNSPALYTI